MNKISSTRRRYFLSALRFACEGEQVTVPAPLSADALERASNYQLRENVHFVCMEDGFEFINAACYHLAERVLVVLENRPVASH